MRRKVVLTYPDNSPFSVCTPNAHGARPRPRGAQRVVRDAGAAPQDVSASSSPRAVLPTALPALGAQARAFTSPAHHNAPPPRRSSSRGARGRKDGGELPEVRLPDAGGRVQLRLRCRVYGLHGVRQLQADPSGYSAQRSPRRPAGGAEPCRAEVGLRRSQLPRSGACPEAAHRARA